MNYTGHNTVYDYLKNIDMPDGIHSMQLANNEIIDFEIYNYLEDTVFYETPVLGDNIPDTKMLILKFHKNLTINAGVTITPQVRKKGMVIYCSGTIESNGTISMTARGANAIGQDVLLYKNIDDSYEFVPKAGANGGSASITSHIKTANGVKGADGLDRQSGGGGSGASRTWRSTGRGYTYSGTGAAGTSYSGGSGGGGIHLALNSNSNNYYAGSGGINGGAGGFGWAQQGNSSPVLYCGGGAGNNGGSGEYSRSGNARTKYSPIYGQNGTGGLLIIIAQKVINKGSIIANGCNGGACNLSSGEGEGGGASGGGSINIFYKYIDTIQENIIASGGEGGYFLGGTALGRGGAGGNGSINLTDISTKYYLIKNNNKYLYYLDNAWETLDHDPTSEDFLTYGIYDLSIIPVELWTKLSGEIEILLGTDTRKNRNINFKAIPKDQILLYISDVDLTLAKTIKYIVAEDNILNNGIIKRLISVDSGNTWLYFNNRWLEYEFINPLPKEDYNEHNSLWSNWINSDHTRDIENIKLIGLSQEQLSNNGITSEQWIELLAEDNFNKKLRFLTIISIDNYTDKAELRNINMLYDKFGEYIENRNFIQRQALNQIIITPQFSSKEIKINYIL